MRDDGQTTARTVVLQDTAADQRGDAFVDRDGIQAIADDELADRRQHYPELVLEDVGHELIRELFRNGFLVKGGGHSF